MCDLWKKKGPFWLENGCFSNWELLAHDWCLYSYNLSWVWVLQQHHKDSQRKTGPPSRGHIFMMKSTIFITHTPTQIEYLTPKHWYTFAPMHIHIHYHRLPSWQEKCHLNILAEPHMQQTNGQFIVIQYTQVWDQQNNIDQHNRNRRVKYWKSIVLHLFPQLKLSGCFFVTKWTIH